MSVQLSGSMALLYLLLLATVADAKARCKGSDICRFRHCKPFPGQAPSQLRAVIMRPPFAAPPGPVICLNDLRDTMGFVRSTGEAIIEQSTLPDIPISKWRPANLSRNFPKDFFQTVPVAALKKSGIAKVANKGNQQDSLRDVCVRLPITSYERINKKTGAVKRIITGGKPSDCIAFQTRTAKLLIELNWEGGDDLDLEVSEPSGRIVDRFNSRGTVGRFTGDRSGFLTSCDILASKELVRYLSSEQQDFGANVPRGRYTVFAFHQDNCGLGPTKWNVRVSVDGELKMFEEGISNRNDSGLILRKTFKF